MTRASEYARRMKETKAIVPPPFVESGQEEERWTAMVTDSGELLLAPRLTQMTVADVRRFIVWLHAAFDEEPF